MKQFALALICLFFSTAWSAEPVCKVVDGDTFHLCNGFKVRLDGIDTPEKGEPFYWEARRALAALIQTPTLNIFDCHLDTTGKRYACKVTADGKDIQAELVRQGMAWDWPKFSGKRYQAEEEAAQKVKLGIWGNPDSFNQHWSSRKR